MMPRKSAGFKIFASAMILSILGCASLEEPPATRKSIETPKKPARAGAPSGSQKPNRQSAQGAPPAPIPTDDWTLFRNQLKSRSWTEALATSENLVKTPNLSNANQAEIYQGRMMAHENLGDGLAALNDAQLVTKNPSLAKEAEPFRIHSAEIIEGRLNSEALSKAADDLSDNSLRAQANFRLGQISLENKDQSAARRYFGRAVNLDPNSDVGRRAQDLLGQLEAVKRVESKTVGVILPMSGKFSSISEKTLRGVEMGLGLYGSNISSFKLAVIDSEGNPDAARKGVERLVKEDNVISIIGSVLSKTASGVASKSNELGVPSINLSQKSGITESGPMVFRNALTGDMQIRYLAKTAIEDLKMKRFAILYPNDQYGVEYANIFWDEILARGGSITSVQSYSPKETDFRYVIQRLVGTYYLEDRADEYKVRLKEWSAQQGKKAGRNAPPDDLLPPLADFDAIFIPDSAKSMGQISGMLAFNNVRGVKLLGTNLWNVPGLAKRATNSVKELVFVDSFVSTDPNFQNSSFVREYKTLFGEEPGIFEIQGYDSGLILRQLIAQGNTSRESLAGALGRLQEFPGALGSLSVTPEREILRPLQALTVENGEIVPLKSTVTR